MPQHVLLKSEFLLPLWRLLLHWYLVERPQIVLRAYFVYSKAFREIFSLVFLLKTMFKPWKNIIDKYPTKGFNLNLMFQSFTFNCVTRLIGAIIRFSCMIAGIMFQIGMFVGFFGYLILWYAFPAVFAFGILFILYSL